MLRTISLLPASATSRSNDSNVLIAAGIIPLYEINAGYIGTAATYVYRRSNSPSTPSLTHELVRVRHLGNF